MKRQKRDGNTPASRRRRVGLGLVGSLAMAGSLISATALSSSTSTAALNTSNATLAALAAPVAKLLDNTVPSIVGSATRLGAIDPSTPLTLVLPLTLPHQSQLDAYVQSEYTQGSANYHQFLNPSGFATLFGASTARIDAVTAILEKLGFTVAAPSANHLYVEATGAAGLVEQTFNTVIDQLRLPATITSAVSSTLSPLFTSNVTNLTLPASLANLVSGVEGLDSLDVPHPNVAFPTAAARALEKTVTNLPERGVDGGTSPCLGAIAGAGYTAPGLAEAYNFNGLYGQGLLGQGMTASLVEFTDFHDQNVQTVQQCYGSSTDVQRVYVDGGGSTAPGELGEVEAMSDMTVMLEMLPKLANLDVYVAPNTPTSEYDLYNAFVTNDDSPVLSASWGSCEELESQSSAHLLNEITEEAAAQGQQIFAAAGDSGAVDCRPFPAPTGTSISVETEAASPFVTGIGGTDLGVRATLGLGHDEDTWNDDGAGGGGQSTYWTMPSWQAAAASTRTAPGATGAACGAPAGTLCREVPDLSANADPDFGMQTDTQFQFKDDVGSPGYSIYCGTPNCDLTAELGVPVPIPYLPQGIGGWQPVAGTSLATPLIASAALLWDQAAQNHGLHGLGFINPELYKVASNPAQYARDFFDVTTDSNDAQYSSMCPTGCNTNHLYDAAPGYDLATGLGSINAANLGADLVSQAAAITITPSALTMYGDTGGPSRTEPVTVSSGASGSYNAISNASWMHVSGGTFGHPLSWSVNPTGLGAGTYNGIILAAINGSYATMKVTYVVTPPAVMDVTPGSLTFTEQAVTTKGAPTAPTCNSTLWADELTTSANGTAPSASQLASTLGQLKITNNGPAGSQLHWLAFFDDDTSQWISQDLNPPGAAAQQVPTQPIVNTEGSLGAGQSETIPLASVANVNSIETLPDVLNQGTYHGEIIVTDLANLQKTFFIPITLVLGNGKGTPTPVSTPNALNVSVPAGQSTSTSVVLSDASKACGYGFSISSNVPWASIPQGSSNGEVAGLGGTTTVPVTIDASGLSPGTYHGTLTEQSANADPNPVTIPITLTVT